MKVEDDTKFGMNVCVYSFLPFPVTEDGRKVLVEFVHNHWWQRRLVESTHNSIVSIITKVEYALSCASESVRDPTVGNREEPLGFLDEV